MTEQLEEEEESKRALEKQLNDTKLQLNEFKKRAEENEELVGRLEDLKKRNMKELEEQVPQASAVLYFTPQYCGRRAGPTCYCCTILYTHTLHMSTGLLSNTANSFYVE